MEVEEHPRYVTPYYQGLIHGLAIAKVEPIEIAKITGFCTEIGHFFNKITQLATPVNQQSNF